MLVEQRKWGKGTMTEFSELNALREFVLNEFGVYGFTRYSYKAEELAY
jgi:hypothetical protein